MVIVQVKEQDSTKGPLHGKTYCFTVFLYWNFWRTCYCSCLSHFLPHKRGWVIQVSTCIRWLVQVTQRARTHYRNAQCVTVITRWGSMGFNNLILRHWTYLPSLTTFWVHCKSNLGIWHYSQHHGLIPPQSIYLTSRFLLTSLPGCIIWG